MTEQTPQTQPPMPEPAAPPASVPSGPHNLFDGEWHRMHPATPILRGGLAIVVLVTILFNSMRDLVFQWLLPEGLDFSDGDPVRLAWEHGVLGWVVLAALGGIVLATVGFYFSWRVHKFRITGDQLEMQKGIVFRQERRAPLARIQGINVQKSLIPRILGLCKLEVQQAGADANVELAYLRSSVADDLRLGLLARARGQSTPAQASSPQTHQLPGYIPAAAHPVVNGLAREFLAPDAELADVAPDSLVRMPAWRVIVASIIETGVLIWFPLMVAAAVIAVVTTGEWFLLVTILPGAIGAAAHVFKSIGAKLRFSIAQTRDGIRLAYGLASTTSEVLPAGRIFSVAVSQPLLWRPFGWWKVTFTRASQGSTSDAMERKDRMNSLLPVGSIDDVYTVLRLVVPDLASSGLLAAAITGTGSGSGFVCSPKRARFFRWFSWKRNGMAFAGGNVLIRTGAVWRTLAIVPLARVQSVAIQQGPVYGMAGLGRLVIHVVGLSNSPSIGALDVRDIERGFAFSRNAVAAAIVDDTTDTWAARPPQQPVVTAGPALPAPTGAPVQLPPPVVQS